MPRARSILILSVVTLTASPSFGFAQERCLSREAGRQMLESGRIVPFPDAARRAGIAPEQIQGVNLCPSGRSYKYEVDVLRSRRKGREAISAEPEPKPLKRRQRKNRPTRK